MTTTTYHLKRHVPSGEVYAIRLADNERLTGTCGPLHHSEVSHYGDLEMLEYSMEDVESGWWGDQEWQIVDEWWVKS